MKPAKRFATTMCHLTDSQCRAHAEAIARDAGIPVPQGLTGKTTLRIVARNARLKARDYAPHREALLGQLALLGAS